MTHERISGHLYTIYMYLPKLFLLNMVTHVCSFVWNWSVASHIRPHFTQRNQLFQRVYRRLYCRKLLTYPIKRHVIKVSALEMRGLRLNPHGSVLFSFYNYLSKHRSIIFFLIIYHSKVSQAILFVLVITAARTGQSLFSFLLSQQGQANPYFLFDYHSKDRPILIFFDYHSKDMSIFIFFLIITARAGQSLFSFSYHSKDRPIPILFLVITARTGQSTFSF